MLTGEMLAASARRHPDRLAAAGEGARLSFRDLDRRANRVANALRAALPGKGRHAGILSRNIPDYAAVHFGAARSGHVLVHVSTRYAAKELAYVLDNADVEFLIVEPQFLVLLEPLRASLPKLLSVVALGPDFERWLEGASDAPPSATLNESQPVGMTYTGGTTGFPKGVLVSHAARALTARSAAAECRLSESDIICVATPLFHVAGLYVLFQPAVLAGAGSVLLAQWSPEAFVAAVAAEGVTMSFLVPSQVNQLLRWPGFPAAKPRLKTLRRLSFAGAPMPDALQRELMAELPSLELIQNYGQSETGSLTWLPVEEARSKIGSVGRQGQGIVIDIFDPTGRPVGPGNVGEIVTRGANTMLGYYKKPDETRDFFKTGGGWGWTGDLGYRDAEGYVYLVDRSKDMIISGGENVFPKEIENAIHDIPGVAECAVFGVPHDDWGEVPKAYVVLKPGARLSEDEIVAHCERTLARFKRPRAVAFVEDFPRTAIGKIQKNLLREPYWRGRAKRI